MRWFASVGLVLSVVASNDAAAQQRDSTRDREPVDRVFFDTAATTLGEEARRVLGALVDMSLGDDECRIALAGHADRRGPDWLNDELSRRRAQAVRAYLVGRGIPAGRIAIEAHGGKQRATAGDGSEESLARDRRVDIFIECGSGPAEDGASSNEAGTQ